MTSGFPSGGSTTSLTNEAWLHEDRSKEVIGACSTLIVLSAVAVFLRLWSRWISHAGFWWDDFFIIVAMVLSWGPNLANLYGIHHGFAKHIIAQPPETVFLWFKTLYAFEFLYSLAMCSVKYSIIMFQYRIFPIAQFRKALIFLLYFVIALTISCLLVSLLQCVPIHDFWDTLAGKLDPLSKAKCINIQKFFLISGAINAVTDFALLALPIPILWRLKTGKPQKLVLTGIFVVGLTVCAVSIVRLVVLANASFDDITWNYTHVAIWTAAEPSIAVVSACLPSLRPLFVRLLFRKTAHHKPSHPPTYNNSFNSASWNSSSNSNNSTRKEKHPQNPFNNLQESHGSNNVPERDQWAHNVKVYGGNWAKNGRVGVGMEEYHLEPGQRSPAGETAESDVPLGRIRARTEVVVSISERVDWKSDLF